MILLGLSGHGHFDLSAYDAFLAGRLEDPEFSEDDMAYAARFWGENVHRLTKAETRFFATYVMAPLLRQGLSEQEMLDIAIPQGAIAQALDERVLLWLHRRHTEANLIQDVLEHIEAAIERAGAVRRRPRAAPAIGFLDLSGFTALTEAQGDEAAVQLSVRLDELVRDATHDHGGYPVKSLGDGHSGRFGEHGHVLERQITQKAFANAKVSHLLGHGRSH